jgi:hypothetical protein
MAVSKPKKKIRKDSDLKPGEVRVKSEYKSLYDQGGIDPGSIRRMTPSDTLSGTYSKPGYRVDLSRSMTSTKSGGSRIFSQAAHIKLAKPKKETIKKETARVETVKKEVPKREEITAKLQTRKLTSSPINKTIQKSSITKKTAVEEPKYKPEAKTKKLTANATLTGNIATGIRNVISKQKFEKEKRQNEALKRTSRGMGSDVSLSALKEKKADLKQIKKMPAAKVEIKDTRKAIRLKTAQSKGRTKYFK